MTSHEEYEYIQSTTKQLQHLVPQLQSLVDQSIYNIFVEFVEHIADESSCSEVFASISGRIQDIVRHPYFDNSCYDVFKAELKSIYYYHQDIHTFSLRGLEDYIDNNWLIHKKIINLQQDIKDYRLMAINKPNNADYSTLLDCMNHLLELYDNYLYSFQWSLLSDSQKKRITDKSNQLIHNIEFAKNNILEFQKLLQTEQWESLMNLILSSDFLAINDIKQENYPYILLYYEYVDQAFHELITLVNEIHIDQYNGDLTIEQTLSSYHAIMSSFQWEILQLRDNVVYGYIANIMLQSFMKQLFSSVLQLWKYYCQKHISNLNNLKKNIIDSGIELSKE